MISFNIKFPIEDDPNKNFFCKTTKTTKEALGANLLLLLLTQKGERYYQPDYGTNLLRFIFDHNDTITQPEIEEEIKRTISLYIPQLEIDEISFFKNVDDDGVPIPENQLTIKIRFTYTEDTFIDSGEIELNF